MADTSLHRDALVLVASLGLYLANNIVLKPLGVPGALGAFLAGHLNDIVCGMAFMAYTNVLFAIVHPQVRLTRLTQLLPFSLACGLFWEYVSPRLLRPSTSDPWDLLCYVAGAFAYWLVCRVARSRRQRPGARREDDAGRA